MNWTFDQSSFQLASEPADLAVSLTPSTTPRYLPRAAALHILGDYLALKRAKNKRIYMIELNTLLRHFLANVGPVLDAPAVARAVDQTAAERGLAPRRHAMIYIIVKAFLRWAYSQHYCERDITPELPTIKVPKWTRRVVVTTEEYRALVAGMTDPIGQYLLRCLWVTPFNVVDACLLQWKHVDMNELLVEVPRSKTGNLCTVPILHGSDWHLDLLRLFNERLATVGIPPSIKGNHYVHNLAAKFYLSQNQGARERVWGSLIDACRNAGIRKIRWADFRATFLTAAMGVADAAHVMQMSGHSDPKTLDRYVTPSAAKLNDITQRSMMNRR